MSDEIYKKEFDVIAFFQEDAKKWTVFEQLATIKVGDYDYFVLTFFLKDKTRINLDYHYPIIIMRGVIVGKPAIKTLLTETETETYTSLKGAIFKLFKHFTKDKYNFPDDDPMTFCYKEKEIDTDAAVVAIKVEMNELLEKIARKKAHMLPPFIKDETPEEIQKTAQEILILLEEHQKKTNELAAVLLQRDYGISINNGGKNNELKKTLISNNNGGGKSGFKCTACGTVYSIHLPHCAKCGSPFLKFTDAEDGTFWGTKSKVEGYGNTGPCYIATAVYGDYNAPEVLILRNFRDKKLMPTVYGRLFVKIYYAFSPTFADKLKHWTKVNAVVKKCLNKFINYLKYHK